MKIFDFLNKHYAMQQSDYPKVALQIIQNSNIDEMTAIENLEYIIGKFNLTHEEFKKILKNYPQVVRIYPEMLEEKSKNYKELYSIQDDQVKSLFLKFTHGFTMTREEIVEKVNFLTQFLNMSEKTIKNILLDTPSILSLRTETIADKTNYLLNNLGVDIEQFGKLLKRFPAIIQVSKETYEEQKKFFESEYGVSSLDFAKIVKKIPSVLMEKQQHVIAKEKLMEYYFDMPKQEFAQMFMKFPSFLSRADNSVWEKKNFIEDNFDLTAEEVKTIIAKQPVVISMFEESLMQKKKSFDYLGLSKEYILKNSMIFATPPDALIIRYAILRQIVSREEVLNLHSWFVMNENKSYARLQGLKESGQPFTLRDIMRGETEFQERKKLNSEKLMKQYHLSEEKIMAMKKAVPELKTSTHIVENNLEKHS